MTKLKDILWIDELEEMIRMKRINVQFHPTLPLRIYNYSNLAQFAGEWSNAERVCRGLIVDSSDTIIARGPSKFFNYGQTGAPEVALDEKVWVTKKEDGSLGIGWEYDGNFGVATRGSFTSDQALKAAEMLTANDKRRIKFHKNKDNATEIYEIVYPENRIVLDYKGESQLIRLGWVGLDSGLIEARYLSVLYGNGGLDINMDHEMTLAEALALPIPDDEEGYVLDIRSFDTPGDIRGHIKLKGENYIRLHGAIFGLSERKIWEVLGEGIKDKTYIRKLNNFILDLPDELQPWARSVADRIRVEWEDRVDSILFRYHYIEKDLGKLRELPRGEVAREFMKYPDSKGPLFSVLDGNHLAVKEWAHKQVKPAHKLFRTESEDSN